MLKNVQKRIHRIVIMHGIDDKKYILINQQIYMLPRWGKGCVGG